MPTKADLMTQAQQMGLEVDDSMTKDEIQALIDDAEASVPSEPEEGEEVCVQCGEPATFRTTNKAVNEVFYCDEHARVSGEPSVSLAEPQEQQ
jgi:hypothetical protein